MNQLDTILLPEKAVQLAFGLTQCAHSSVVQKTLDACSSRTVTLQQANEQLYHRYGQALSSDCSQEYLLLDLDVTGLLAGQQAEESTKGYFANHRGCSGRQLCRVIATAYHEILCQALLPGDTLSKATLKPAIRHACRSSRMWHRAMPICCSDLMQDLASIRISTGCSPRITRFWGRCIPIRGSGNWRVP